MKYDYDILVIGSGSGWLTVSLGLAAAGKKVALVERAKIGGDCTNYGCVPSKALIDIAKSGKYTFQGAMTEMRNRRQMIQDEETPEKIEAYGLKVIAWFATFKDANTIRIDGKTEVSAKYIVISTGSHANVVRIPGVEDDDILTNETVFEMTEDIKDLVVLGGGYIGCELAEAFQNLGVRVTIVQRNERLIPREEPQSSKLLRELFESNGMRVLTRSSIEKAEDRNLVVKDKDGNIQTVRYDKILVALGREANIANLGLENISIRSDKGIIVNEYSRTNIKNIFAIGDCVDGNPQFTHLANNEGRGVIRNILVPFWKNSLRSAVLPAVLYTTTEVARVGKTEDELIESIGKNAFRTETIGFASNDRSKLTNDTQWFVKIHFKRMTGQVLGATIMGTKAGEMLPVLVSAMQQHTSAYKLGKLIFPYPTKAEAIKKVCDRFVVYTLSHIKEEIWFLLKDHVLQIFTLILWGGILSAFFYFKSQYALTNIDIARHFYLFLTTSYWGPMIYIIAYAIRPVVFFPATFLSFMSGNLFGIGWGFFYDMIGANLSALFTYSLGKVFWKKLIPDDSTGVLNDMKQRLKKSSFVPTLLARLLFVPFDLVGYVAGALRANRSGFLFWTILGIIPGALVFITAGASVKNIESFDFSQVHFDGNVLAISAWLFGFSLVLASILRKWERSRKTLVHWK